MELPVYLEDIDSFERNVFRKCISRMISDKNKMFYGYFASFVLKKVCETGPAVAWATYVNNKPAIYLCFNKVTEVIKNHIQTKIDKSEEISIAEINQITFDSVTMLIVHELEHIIRMHHLYTKLYDMNENKIANIAYDTMINGDILSIYPEYQFVMDLFKGCTSEVVKKQTGVDCDKYNTSYERYKALLKSKKQPDGGDGYECDLISPVLSDSDDYEDSVDCGDIPMQEMETIKEKLDNMIGESKNLTEKNRGTVPKSIDENLNGIEIVKNRVALWRRVIRKLTKSISDSSIRFRRNRYNKRLDSFGVFKLDEKPSVVFGIDSSGSMSDNDIIKALQEVHQFIDAGGEVHLVVWDCEAEYRGIYKKSYEPFKRTKSGGTRYGCFTEWCNDNKKKYGFSLSICITDGYVENNITPCSINTITVLSSGGAEVSLRNKSGVLMPCVRFED